MGSETTRRRLCFITIGATASFDPLIEAALSPNFLDALHTLGYTDLLLQHGTEGSAILDRFKQSTEIRHEVNIQGFEFNKQGLGAEMRAAKGGENAAEGVVISHAGMYS